jgi:hypothetical protein
VEGSGRGGAPGRGGRGNGGVNGFNAFEGGARLRGGGLMGSDGGAVTARAASRGAELGSVARAVGDGGGTAELGRSQR